MIKSIIFVLVFILFSFWIQSQAETKRSSFSVDLTHRDSILSPFYNHSLTPLEVLRNAVLRSHTRINLFQYSSLDLNEEEIESVVIPNGGDYLMKIYVGSPPVEVLAIADTGSDLIWIQCTPCDQCYKQDAPLFNPSKSSTYKELSCATKLCQALPKSMCGSTQECKYSYSYGDRSYTIGILSSETIGLDSSNGEQVSFPASAFGCGHRNNGTFTRHVAGLVGLGGGPLSLVSQLADQIENKFSYCLLPMSSSTNSKLRFGQAAILSRSEVVSTPIISKSPPTFYFLTLEGISIGGKIAKAPQSQGNIVIDSGTTLTLLQSNLYNQLEAIVKEAIGVNPVADPSGTLDLCFQAESVRSKLPEMVFHFTGADIHLPPLNTFAKFDNLVCMLIAPSEEFSIFGNLAQVNFQVEYDLQQKKVSFAPTDCTAV
ncbi:putative Eukaryotic aspartyl protease family protein [Tripterygium wilfordii]|uniref:Putative Eukaryotic aspartyl protease family protein n=1 Tax=Tripterygium wilfordii TaxID=458696 RepID=A0A7J7C9Y8_TRIWF|nr:probable aspartic protease At2g35615 [Tripterygium wilfordii]KAF5730745.1 putative Eukaryotic aspartyl protease family protein [Tripterygium wilfordii]